MTALFGELATSIAGEVTRRAVADGTVPRAALTSLQQAAGERVTRLFLGLNRRQEWAALDELPNGAVIPLSPYAAALWTSLAAVVRIPVEKNAAMLRKRLPEDLWARLRTARLDPFAAARELVQEQAFRPNPLATYDAPHTWVDPNGYRLSDRIWRSSVATRRQVDRLLEESIAAGRSAADIARDLERFLVPGRLLERTGAPYGRDASYDAMRLARTEISRAHAEAQRISANMNPFVTGVRVALSHRHPRPDICDVAAGAGPWPKDDIPAQYMPPLHPHCLCSLRYVLAENSQAILDELRDEIRRERLALGNLIGPAQVDRFTDLLLGQPLRMVRTQPGSAPVPVLAGGRV
jgi:hypothetical protein